MLSFLELASQCHIYEIVQSLQVLSLDLPSHQLPKNECISIQDLECETVQLFLESGHDNINVNELQHTDNIADCENGKRKITARSRII